MTDAAIDCRHLWKIFGADEAAALAAAEGGASKDEIRERYGCVVGVADVSANEDPQSKDTVAASHHDRPLYILAKEPKGRNIRKAPFINHTDQELMLIETLVGRKPPFIFPKDDYGGPRRDY